MKKIHNFYARVLVDVDMLSSLSQQLLMERPGFAFIDDMEYEQLLPFAHFIKWFAICYLLAGIALQVIGLINKWSLNNIPKFNLGTRKENVYLHTKVVNVDNIVIGNYSKSSSLGGDIVAPNNVCDQEDSLETMSSLVNDSQQASPIQNIEQIQHVSPKGDLAHLFGLTLSISFSRLSVLYENLSQNKYENVNIVDYNPPLLLQVSLLQGKIIIVLNIVLPKRISYRCWYIEFGF